MDIIRSDAMFSERLKKLRTEKHLSQKELAEKLEMSQQAIAKWENNQTTPNPEMLVRIADFFDVSADYLLGRISQDIFIDKKNTRNFSNNRLEELMVSKNTSAEDMEQLLNTNKYEIATYIAGIRCPEENDLQKLSTYFETPIEFITGESDSSNYSIRVIEKNIRNGKNIIKQVEIPEGKTYIVITKEEKKVLMPMLNLLRKQNEQ